MPYRNPYYDPAKPHHTPTGFRNLTPTERHPGDFQRWNQERKAQGLPHAPALGYEAFLHQWWQPADFSGQEDAVWWLGHACVLLRLGGRYVLIDPELSARASPLFFAGPRRKTPPAATVDQLPAIDAVLISHNHYDHLDDRTIRALVRRFPGARFLAPLGLGAWLKRRGAWRVSELDWWDTLHDGDLSLVCVPAQHWSQRTLWNRNRTLWCGWAVLSSNLRFYFPGDTAYAPHLQEIGRRLGPFDLASLPIGAYEPRWFMQGQHVDPFQSVQLYRELRCRHAFGMHWASFELADESLDAPPVVLQEALQACGEPSPDFRLLPIGGRLDMQALTPSGQP